MAVRIASGGRGKSGANFVKDYDRINDPEAGRAVLAFKAK